MSSAPSPGLPDEASHLSASRASPLHSATGFAHQMASEIRQGGLHRSGTALDRSFIQLNALPLSLQRFRSFRTQTPMTGFDRPRGTVCFGLPTSGFGRRIVSERWSHLDGMKAASEDRCSTSPSPVRTGVGRGCPAARRTVRSGVDPSCYSWYFIGTKFGSEQTDCAQEPSLAFSSEAPLSFVLQLTGDDEH